MIMNHDINVENKSLKLENESLSTQLKNQSILMEQIDELRKENTALKMIIDKQSIHIKIQDEKLADLENAMTKQTEHFKSQDIKICHLEIDNANLNKDNADLKKNNIDLNMAITTLQNDVKLLKKRDEPITVREGMVVLEEYIMIEILGSKKKARYFPNILDLFNDNNYVNQCQIYLTNHGITRDHVNLMVQLRRDGNYSAHNGRPLLTRSEWNDLIISAIDPNDVDDVRMSGELLSLLEKYSPPNASDPWEIEKP